MNPDLRFLFRLVGCFPAVLGAVVATLGMLYAFMGWRFGGAVSLWSWMWGLMLIGLGLVIMSTGRRWLAFVGVTACGASAFLVFWWEGHVASLGEWPIWIYGSDALGIVFGLVAIAYFTWST